MVTCRYCKEKVSRDKATKVGKSSYFHPECLDTKEQIEEEKKRESEDYKSLIDYICNLYNITAPTGMILKQIKEYREDPYNYKISGIKLSLQYFYEIEGNNVLDDAGIGIIPYVYEKAKKHYIMKKNVEKSLEDFEQLEIRSVEVTSPKNIKPKNNVEYIDMCTL